MAPHTQHRDPSTQLAAPASMPQGALAALQRGDLKGMLQAYAASTGLDVTKAADDTEAGKLRAILRAVAADMLELRRENVAVLGSSEAFVRRFPNGALKQVIRPVQLSVDDGTLYRIPVRWARTDAGYEGVYDETKAQVTAMGLDRLNAVAGCNIGLPASVSVEGVEHANPYVERAQTPDGPGDVRRIVVKVIVIGPSPATGNPVGVTYLLDYDPRVDLRLALMKLARPQGRGDKTQRADRPVQIIPSSTWGDFLRAKSKDEGADAKFRWHMLPLHAGLVLAYDLYNEDVLEVQQDFLKGTQHLTKKAQTVARRNAMRGHPALAYGTVATPDKRSARLGIVGWTSTGQMDAYLSTLDRLSRGLPLPEGALEAHDVIEATYDDDMAEDANAAERAEAGTAPATSTDHEREQRHLLISQIDDAMMATQLRPGEITALGYQPSNNTIEELRAILARLTASR